MSTVKKSDLIEGDPLKEFRDSITDTKDELVKYNKELRDAAAALKKDVDKANTKSAKGIKDLNKITKESTKLAKEKTKTTKKLTVYEKESLKLDKALEKAKAQKTLATSKENKELQKLKKEKKETNKAGRDEEKQLKRNKNAYTKLSDASREFKNESKRLGAELLDLEEAGKKDTAQFKKLEKEFGDVTAKARKTDGQLKKLGNTVGDNQRSVGKYSNATRKLSSAMGALGIAAGIGGAVTAIFNLNRELSKAENVASSFFDTTEEGNKSIAREASTMAKVFGKDVNEVLRSANVLSKQFGITGEKSLSILNSGFEKGADVSGELLTNVSEYSTQLRLAGLSAEQSIAIITESQQAGVFSDKGIDSIKEATLSLREMTPVAREALDAIGMSADQVQKDIASGSKSYFDVIQEISTKTGEVGEKSEAAGMILADIFKGAGEDAGDFVLNLGKMNTDLGELEDQNKGLDGAVQNLVRSWSEFTQGLSDSTNTTGILSGTLNFLADNLVTIIKWVAVAATGFLAYKGAMIAGKVATVAYTFATKAFAFVQALLAGNLKKATAGMKLFNLTTKMNPIGLLIGLITAAVAALGLFSSATDKQTEATKKAAAVEKKLNDQLERGNKARKDRTNTGRDIDTQFANRAKSSQLELKATKQLIEADKLKAEQNILNLKTVKEQLIEDKKRLKSLIEYSRATSVPYGKAADKLEATELRLQKIRNNGAETLENEQNLLNLRNKQLAEIIPFIKEDTDNTDDNTDAADANADAKDRQKEAQDRLNSSLSRSLEIQSLTNDIERENMDTFIEGLSDVSEGVIEDEVQAIEDGNLSILMSYKERIAEIKKLFQAETDARVRNANDNFEFEKLQIQGNAELNYENERTKIKLSNDSEKEKNAKLKKLKDEFDKDQVVRNLKLEKLEIKHQKEILKIKTEGGEDEVAGQKKIDDALEKDEKERKEKEAAAEAKAAAAAAEAQKELYDTVNDVQKNITDVITEETDKRIKALQDEVSAQKELRSSLQAQADAGNVDAKDSIKETIELERQKAAEIARLEKRKQQIQLISQGLETYTSLVAGGEKPAEAFAQTVVTSQALISFLSGLSGFEKGTENAPEGYAKTQEKGAEIITDKKGKIKSLGSDKGSQLSYLNKGDKVKTAKDSASMFQSFDNLSNMDKVPKQDNAGNSYDLMQLGSKLDRVEQAIKSQPHDTTDWENITKNLGAIRTTTNKGGDTFTSKHYVKK